jgi:hypothetical protein
MAEGNGTAIKGIGIAVTADASQIKRVFNEAIAGFEGKTIQITLTAKEDASFGRIFRNLSGKTIDIGVRLQPTRQSIRDFRKDFNERLAKERGVQTPVSVKPLTLKEGRDLKRQIARSIGQVPIDVILNWKWGPGGPPPTSFGGGIGGPPAGGGFGTGAAGPVAAPSQADVDAFIRAEVARRMAAQVPQQGPGTGTFTRQAAVPVEEVGAPAAQAVKAPRKPREPHRFDQVVGETEEAWTKRLTEERGKTLKKLSSTSENVRIRANNTLVQLEKRLGIDEGRQHIDVPGKSVVGREGKTSTIAPAAQEPGPTRVEGRLLADVIAEGFKEARQSGDLTGPTPGSPAAERAKLQKELGIKVGPQGITDLGDLAKQLGVTSAAGQNRLIERLNNRIFDREGRDRQRTPGVEILERELADFRRARTEMEATLKQPRRSSRYRDVAAGIDELEKRLAEIAKPEGAFGGGKVSRSIHSGQEAAMQFVGTPGPSERVNAPRQRQIVEEGGALGAFVEELLSGKRGNFISDIEQYQKYVGQNEFVQGQPAQLPNEPPQIAAARLGFVQGEKLRQGGQTVRALFGDTRYNPETERFEPVPPGEKLPTGEESTGFRGVIPLRAELDAAARAGQLPGVGKGAVRYAQAETRDDIREGKFTEGGLDYITKRDALTAIIQGIRQEQENRQQDLSRKLSGQQGAATTAEAINPPQRPIMRGRQPEETLEAFRARREQTLAPYNEAVKRFEARRSAREERDAAAAAAVGPRREAMTAADPMREQFAEAEQRVEQARKAVAAARRNPTAVIDQELVGFLNRQLRKNVGLTNLERLRAVGNDLQGADEGDFSRIAKSVKLAGKPIPPGFNAIRGALARIALPNNPFSTRKQRVAEFVQRVSMEPEEIATSFTGPPDRSLIARREAELREARINRVSVGRERLRARRAALQEQAARPQEQAAAPEQELPDLSDVGISRERVLAAFGHAPHPEEPMAMAAGGVVPPPAPPGAVHTGGGGGLGPGGVVRVHVVNFAELKGQGGGTFASGPTSGPPSSADMGKMFQQATAGGVEEAMKKLGWNPREEAEPKAKTPKEEAIEKGGAAIGLQSALNLGSRLGLPHITAEQFAQIRERAGLDRVRGVTGPGDDDITRRLEQSAERARVGIEVSPARAVATATGQIFSNLPIFGGRSRILERGREAAAATSVARQLGDEKAALSATIEVQGTYLGQLKEGTKEHRNLSKSIAANKERLADVSKQYEVAATRATDLNNKVARASDVVRSFGAGVVGTIAGQILFQGVFGAAQGIVSAGAAALGPVVERAGGFQGSTAAVTTGLAQQTAQTGAPTRTLVEQQLAAANLMKSSADRIDKILADRGEIMAGNQQIEAQTKLYAAAANVQLQNARGLGPRGDGRTRFGSDVNLYESTGGILNTSLFAPQQSTQEALGNLFREANRQQNGLAAAQINRSFQNQLAGLTNPIDRQRAIMNSADASVAMSPSLRNVGGAGSIWGSLFGPTAAQTVVGGRTPTLPPILRDESLQGAAKLAIPGSQGFVATGDREAVNSFADALDKADMQDFAAAVRNGSVSLDGLSRDADTAAKQVTRFAENYARGLAQRDPAQLIEGMADQVKAAVAGSLEQGRIQRQLILPAQRDLANQANPVLPFSGVDLLGAPGGGGGAFGGLIEAMGGRRGVEPGAQAAVRRAQVSTLQAQQLQQQQEAQAQGAIDELFKPLGTGMKNAYLEVRSEIKDIGRELAELSQEQVNIQVNLSTQQFDEQLRQLRRAKADAEELTTGIDQPGNGGDNVGLLERRQLILSRASAQVGFQQQQLSLQSQELALQNQLLGRRSQALSFQSTELGFQSKQLGFQATALSLAQQQRQINFQTAAAGFTAPGLTPEERAARIEEAKAEANVAQQQHDIAEKQFAIEQQQFGIEQQQFGIAKAQYELDAQNIAIQRQAIELAKTQYGLSVAQYQTQQALVDAQNQRTAKDLEIQEGLVEAAKEAQQKLQANEKTIENLQRKLQAAQEQAASYLQQAGGVATEIAQTATQLIAQFGGDLRTMADAYAAAWSRFRNGIVGGGTGSGAPSRRGGPVQGPDYNAPGAIGMVSAPTHMVVGDAGGEYVAVLRAPKSMSISGFGGGGQVNITVNVTGNTVRDDRDLDRLAALVSRQVEESLGRRASQLDFRPAR